MHELSIASAIAAIAERHAAGRRVAKVDVRVGHLRQVVPPALEFAWRMVTEGTALDGAELALEVVPAVGRCRDCAAETALNGFPLTCGRCGGFDLEPTAGEELLVDALELEDEALMTTEGVHHGD
jgi:hydrogenase nickel incorporation protein HypA/HybF